jgi:hypothetical protein
MLAPNAPEPLGTLTTDFRRGASICIVFRPSSFVLRARARARARARRSSIDEIASQPTVSPERVTVIQAEKRHLDVRHDDVLRGCYLLPEALAFLTKNRALAAKLTNLQKVLLPEGLLATQKSYREEAGQATLLKSRLSNEDIALLKQIKTADGTLWDAIKEWEQLARKLGRRVEAYRALLLLCPLLLSR